MSNVTVPALKPLTYQGRSYVRGELVTVTPVDAAAMARRGEVTLSKGTVIAPSPERQRESMEAEPPVGARRRRPAAPGPSRPRTHRRRDMTADTEPAE